jgi:hypothetical protein
MSNDRTGRRVLWAAALLVAAAAGVATAHGLYQVATSAGVQPAIGWLYPLITDGLGLVAYAATARLTDRGRQYAAGIVVLAAALSGLAQAVYLAGGLDHAAPALRFGVGAWPALAVAFTAHLLYLVRPGNRTRVTARTSQTRARPDMPRDMTPVRPVPDIRPARTGHDTAARVAALRHTQPGITQAAAAVELGVSVRTVARHWGRRAVSA